MKMKKTIISILSLVFVCAMLLSSCGLKASPKTFSTNGMSITLTNQFKIDSYEGYTSVYDSRKVAVFTLKEDFSLVAGMENYTLKEYGEIVMKANNLTGVSLQTKDGLTWFEYDFENTELKKTYHYYSYVYKASDAFWLIQFACLKSDVDTCAEDILSYAKSVTFD